VTRIKKTTCDYVNPQTTVRCHREPRYVMYLLVHGESIPRMVTLCATCDKNMGRKRLMELGWPHEDAIKWEKNPSHIPSGLEMRTNGPQRSIRSTRREQYMPLPGHVLTGVNPRY